MAYSCQEGDYLLGGLAASNCLPWTVSLPWTVRPGARVPARRNRHDLYSMTSETAGKCSFPLRRRPRRSKILVPFQGTGEG